MKLSLHWLRDLVDLEGIGADQIADELTMRSALIEEFTSLAAELQDVKVAHVVERQQHPNADRLSLCVVDTGVQKIEVVCGAPNVAAGQRIAYAPVGGVLPGGFKLSARKIRGVVSNGMICSEKELGTGEDAAGILVLDADAPIGASLVEYLHLDDVIFDIDNKTVTHRPDLWGHLGFARELAAIFGRSMKPYAVQEDLQAEPAGDAIELQDPAGCPLYLGLRIEGASGKLVAPDWMARRLRATEMRPLSLLVDLSNYVMLELGQPTHPFDFDKLKEGRILVRRALPDETLETLDGQRRKLHQEDLMIADPGGPLAIAGIMGGGSSEVDESTQRVLLESAHFDAVSVRRTSSRLALRTDALARFEKFLDPSLTEIAVRRYAYLLQSIAPEVQILPTFWVAGSAEAPTPKVSLRPSRARKKLGFELSDGEMVNCLNSVDLKVEEQADDRLEVRIPSCRAARDLQHEDDLIEEVGRLAGYHRIPAELPRLAVDPPRRDPLRLLERQVLLTLVHQGGYNEVLSYSFATDRQREAYHDSSERSLSLPNPVHAEASQLRRSLVPGILEHLARNQLHRDQIRLVEVGRSYHPEEQLDGLPQERRTLVAARLQRTPGRPQGSAHEQAVLAMRADLQALFERLKIDWEGVAAEDVAAFAHPGRCISVRCGGQEVGQLGQLHPRLAQAFEIESPTAILELRLDALVGAPREYVQMQAIPQFPAVRRDLSVEAPEETTIAAVLKEIRAGGGARLTRAELFDVYQGKNITEGHRSLAFRLEYRAEDRTLTDEEADQAHQRVVQRLDRLGIRQRA